MAYKARSLHERFWEKVHKSDGCWDWQASFGTGGYGQIVTRKGSSPTGAHRIAYMLSVGDFPQELSILHHCDNPKCVRPDHLYVGDHIDNAKDMHDRGRWSYKPRNQFGEKNPNSILTDKQVASMLNDLASGEGPVNVARKYGISYKTLWSIRRRKAPVC